MKVTGLRKSTCSVKQSIAEDPRLLTLLPAGAVYIFRGSSMHTVGRISFVRNSAASHGGKERLRIVFKYAEMMLRV